MDTQAYPAWRGRVCRTGRGSENALAGGGEGMGGMPRLMGHGPSPKVVQYRDVNCPIISSSRAQHHHKPQRIRTVSARISTVRATFVLTV